jgi:hypothetical protein
MSRFTLQEVRPNIFLLLFDHQYDLGMHFLRFQEYYCCTSERFHGKSFKILDFMEWYAKEYGQGSFTYPLNWAGFNIDGDLIQKVVSAGISDWNAYDRAMLEVDRKCQALATGKYCLIGATRNRLAKGTIKHEIAHGYYYLIPEYRKGMDGLVKSLDSKFRRELFKALRSEGYRRDACFDEAQAYLSTGMPGHFPLVQGQEKAFEKLYKEYDRRNRK